MNKKELLWIFNDLLLVNVWFVYHICTGEVMYKISGWKWIMDRWKVWEAPMLDPQEFRSHTSDLPSGLALSYPTSEVHSLASSLHCLHNWMWVCYLDDPRNNLIQMKPSTGPGDWRNYEHYTTPLTKQILKICVKNSFQFFWPIHASYAFVKTNEAHQVVYSDVTQVPR